MKLLSRKDVAPICKQIAAEHEGWAYAAESFRYKIGNHSTIYIMPLWAFKLSAQPSVWLENKQTTKLIKQVREKYYGGGYPISTMRILRPGATLKTQVYQEFVYDLIAAERYIRDFFARGLRVIEQYYNYSDERELLENIPFQSDGGNAERYCYARIVLGDFEFVESFINDKIKTDVPKREKFISIAKELLPVWKKNYQETGSIFGKQ